MEAKRRALDEIAVRQHASGRETHGGKQGGQKTARAAQCGATTEAPLESGRPPEADRRNEEAVAVGEEGWAANAGMTVPSPEQLEAVEQKARVDEAIVRAAMTRIQPSWNLVQRLPGGGIFRRGSVQVFFSVLRYEDGRTWIHVSLCGRTGSRKFHLPAWEDVKRVKADFIGEDRWAYQVFPDLRNYINQNP